MAKFSTFIIALIVCSFITVGFVMFYNDMNSKYADTTGTYDNAMLEVFNETTSLTNLTEEIQSKTRAEGQKNTLDILGGFFQDAYRVMQLSAKSVDIFYRMNDNAFKYGYFGDISGLLKVTIIAIMGIVIFLGIITSTLVKRDI